MKTAAIYTRKSKFTAKGESIQNQVQICKDYLFKNGYDYKFIIYEDEGFSGKNTERPEFKRMVIDAQEKKFSILICYRLDRVSRNIADFSMLMQKLERYNISFISVNEHFDTSTPMGRAMMYIASVFAQLERETIAERIRDNMLELAKAGRWLGGRTPTGYKSSSIIYLDNEFKERKMFKLTPIKEELHLVKLIFDNYLKLRSLTQVTKYLLKNNIKTKLLKDWDCSQVKCILTNPVYVKATEDTIKFIENKGITVVGSPNGVHGMLSYNKRLSKTGPYRSPSEWIYAIGSHEGIICSEDWVKVQKLLEQNSCKAPRLGQTHTALLTGILRCGKCGGIMRVTYGAKNAVTGKRAYYYSCSMKHKSGNSRCSNKNVRGDVIEALVIDQLNFLSIDKTSLIKILNHKKALLGNEFSINKTKREISIENIAKNKLTIENLLNNLSHTQDTTLSKLLLNKIKELDDQNKLLEKGLNIEKNKAELMQENENLRKFIYSLKTFKSTIKFCTFEEKKNLLTSIIEKAYWHGDVDELHLYLIECLV
ncbi:MAG: recombinase family protein [Bacillota bacterium]|nr:recombinase family protein [Bacillota bacterium]